MVSFIHTADLHLGMRITRAGTPPDTENAWQNAGYVVQWWAFAALTLYGYVYLARREAHPPLSP